MKPTINPTEVVVSGPNLERDNVIIEIFRNRSEMEAQLILRDTGEIIDRIPVSWRARENKLDYLSVSKIQAYEQCPACFYKQYIAEESKSVDGSNFFTKFGSILHEVCEKVLKIYIENGIIVDPDSILNEVWKKYNLTGLENYEQCSDLLRKYFNNNPVDKRPDVPVLIEEEWRGELGGCTFGLILDYAGRYKSRPDVGLLRDYKSNRMPFTTADLQGSLQLRIYEIVLRRHLMPDIKEWKTGYDLFFHGWQQCPPRTEDDLKRAEDYVANINHMIKNDNTWEEVLNQYCGYRDCRHTCKTYQKALNDASKFDGRSTVKVDDMDITQLNTERELMTTMEKIAKGRKEECQNMLKIEIENALKRGEKFIVDGKELSLYAGSTSSYRYNDVKNVLTVQNKLHLLEDCLSISKQKFDAKIDATTKLHLASCMSTNYNAPYIVSKKV